MISKVKNITAKNTKLFRYMGSKLKYQAHFQTLHHHLKVKKVGTYIEPFAGTLASLFHNMQFLTANTIVINDINARLINLYKQIQTSPNLVIEKVNLLENEFQSIVPEAHTEQNLVKRESRDEIQDNRSFYYEAKELFNENSMDCNNAALFIFIMNHNFRGKYVENKKGEYSVPFNWSTRSIDTKMLEEHIYNLHHFFNEQNVIFESMSTNELIEKYDDADTFIYLDPPYCNADVNYSSANNTSYENIDSHLSLLESCSKYDFVMYSNNHDDRFIEKLDHHINFSRTNTVSTKKSSRSKQEILGFKINKIVPANNYTPIKELLNIKSTEKEQLKLDTPINNQEFKSSSKKLRCATLFSGIGAAEQAYKNLGIEHTNEYMCEIDEYAQKTFLANHDVKEVFSDVTKIDTANLRYADILVWGSPCQSFSMQGKRGGLEDTRGTLVYNGLKIIQNTLPMYFIFENVTGLLTHQHKRTFKTILNAFEELNYDIQYKVLNAKNFGSPQNRERLFIVGIRKDIKQTFTFPEPQAVTTSVNDLIVKGADYSKYLFDASKAIPFTTKKESDILKKFQLPHLNYEADKRIMSTNGISPCLLSGGGRGKFFDEKNKVFRYLHEKELSQMQGFPADFNFPVSNTRIRKQIGNSIYVGVLEAIMSNLLADYLPKDNDNSISEVIAA